MPTRYTLDVELKGVVSGEVVDDSSKKTDANKVRGAEGPWVGSRSKGCAGAVKLARAGCW
jgi:hypothetical protein